MLPINSHSQKPGCIEFDVAVLGGGIVGLATAMAILRAGHRSVVVLEAERDLALHQTGRNSGVIHSGLYYRPGSLKARLCAEGRVEMERFCDDHGVPFERCGKLVVATNPAEAARLEAIGLRGAANGLSDIRRLNAEQIREIEPNVAGVAGLFVPQTGIVSYPAVACAMSGVVQELGGEVRTAARVEQVHRRAGGFDLATAAGESRAKFIVNCAGLQSDRVARMCGVEPGLRIVPFRGEYFEVVPERRSLIRNLVYPVPDPAFPFLGAHFTRRIDGGVEVGPNAVLAWSRQGYRRGAINAHDAGDMLTYSGTWRLIGRHWRYGLGELRRSWSKAAAVRALRRLVPEITSLDLVPGHCGVRAQAVDPVGRLIDDFRIVTAEGMVHVLNTPSPAATASMAIGRHIAGMVLRRNGSSRDVRRMAA